MRQRFMASMTFFLKRSSAGSGVAGLGHAVAQAALAEDIFRVPGVGGVLANLSGTGRDPR